MWCDKLRFLHNVCEKWLNFVRESTTILSGIVMHYVQYTEATAA